MRLINLSRQGDKFLGQLPPKQFKQIAKAIFSLAKTPEQVDTLKLKGADQFYRKDSGEYRIIYRFDPAVLYVTVVGKRNAVYKVFNRSQ